jgi:predicted permease
VRNVTLSDSPMIGAGWSGTGVSVAGAPPKNSSYLSIGADFFSTLHIPLLRGRGIEDRDRPGAPYVAVVNQAFTKKFFGADDAVGKHVKLPRACAACDMEIVGVVADARYGRLKEDPPPTIFLSISQAVGEPVSIITYQLRTAGNPLGVSNAVRRIVERADPNVPLMRVKTQEALIEGTINQEVTFARLCTAFALLALAIACVGLYGTMSYGVARRTSEIGIRMALGAQRVTVVWMVLREVLTLAGIGLAISLPAALAASKLVESFLYGTKPNDPLTLTAAVLTIAGATILAGYVPARNASRIDPLVALRHE